MENQDSVTVRRWWLQGWETGMEDMLLPAVALPRTSLPPPHLPTCPYLTTTYLPHTTCHLPSPIIWSSEHICLCCSATLPNLLQRSSLVVVVAGGGLGASPWDTTPVTCLPSPLHHACKTCLPNWLHCLLPLPSARVGRLAAYPSLSHAPGRGSEAGSP